MSCSHGRAEPSTATRVRLWAESAGFCGNPDCLARLHAITPDGEDVHFGEAAHIIAASGQGPRGDQNIPEAERAKVANLIMLCANCHRKVDKAPDAYPAVLIHGWKSARIEKTELSLGLQAFGSRAEAQAAIRPLLIQNKEIFKRLGPHNGYSANPEAEEAAAWKRAIVETMIPNHRQVLRIIDANAHLLTSNEEQQLARYRSHVSDLVARHIDLREGMVARQYPKEMDHILG